VATRVALDDHVLDLKAEARKAAEKLTQPLAFSFGTATIRGQRVVAEVDEVDVVGEWELVDVLIGQPRPHG
jgi:hypothetical protein